MKRTLSFVLAAMFLLTVLLAGPHMGPYGVDAVSAATGETTTPAKPAPAKPAPKPTPAPAKPAPAPAKPAPAPAPVKVTPAPAPVVVKTVPVTVGKVEYAAHGTKCFTVAIVALAGDKIVDAIIDDYQVMDKATSVGVPNSNADFGKNFAEGKVLGSKLANAAQYSKNMAEKAGATVPVDVSLAAIEKYAVGKTAAELEAKLAATTKEAMVDAVSGATLVDTHGYLTAIVAAAKEAKKATAVQVDEKLADAVTLVKAEYAAHGTKCFTIAAAALSDNKIVGSIIDDYQVMDKATSVGVPNSDADFGKNFAEGKVLGSKLANAAQYSKNMAEKAKATTPVDESLAAIRKYISGKTASELLRKVASTTKTGMVDAVSGSTLVDTDGYIKAIVTAVKSVEPTVETIDAISTASITYKAAEFEKSLSANGPWIICALKDLSFDKPLVLDGDVYNTKTPPAVQRKIALYTQDEKRTVTARFTLTAPSLTIKSTNARIQSGIFKGDLYVSAKDFQLVDAKVDGNVYFTTQEAKDTFKMDAKSSVTGVQELKK